MLLDLLDGEADSIIVHKILNFLPVAVAPLLKGTQHNKLINSTPAAVHQAIHSSTTNKILVRHLNQLGKAANTVVMILPCYGRDERDVFLAIITENTDSRAHQ